MFLDRLIFELLSKNTDSDKYSMHNTTIDILLWSLFDQINLSPLESGRKALMEADGIRILYTSCKETIDCRELEPVILNASIIMRKCFPRNKLPLENLRSPLCCPLPESDFHIRDTGEGHGIYICLILIVFWDIAKL